MTLTQEDFFRKQAGLQAIKPGLERIAPAYEKLGQPLAYSSTVLIAGTNGKGSTAGYLWQELVARGYVSGLYSSPHLEVFTERLQHSHCPFEQLNLQKMLVDLSCTLGDDLLEQLSFFEIATLLAFCHFADLEQQYPANPACQVIEVGMGGRWDATNILPRVDVSIINTIGWDHQKYLGDSLLKIAQEKAGIIRPNTPVVIGKAARNPDVFQVLQDIAYAAQAPIYCLDQDFYLTGDDHYVLAKRSFALPQKLRSAPRYLKENFLLAQQALCLLQGQPESSCLDGYVGPAAVTLAARFERRFVRLSDDQANCVELLFDGAHNIEAIEQLVDELKEQFSNHLPCVALVTMLKDKDFLPALSLLREVCDPLILFQFPHERSWQLSDLSHTPFAQNFFESLTEAWSFVIKMAALHTGAPIVVTGSLMGLGYARAFFNQYDEKNVPFSL